MLQYHKYKINYFINMIYNYLKKEYKNGEPIILSEIPGKSRDYIRHEIKKLVDEKKLIRVQNGLFYIEWTYLPLLSNNEYRPITMEKVLIQV